MRSPFTLYSLNWRQIISFIFVYTELHTGLLGGKQLSLRLRMQLLRDCPCASNGSQSVTQPQALPARRAARSFSGLCWPFALHSMTGWWDVSCCPAVQLSCSWGVWQFLSFVFLSSVGGTNSLLHCCCVKCLCSPMHPIKSLSSPCAIVLQCTVQVLHV